MSSTPRHRATLSLASFVAALVVALLAPFVHRIAHAADTEAVCSAHGTKQVVAAHGATPATDGHHERDREHGVHCPLCMPAAAPPPLFAWTATPVRPLARARRSISAARLASLVGAPLPARGPPLSV